MEQDNHNINKSNNNTKKSIAERRGFNKNTTRINTTRFGFSGFGATNSSVSPAAHESPYLIIPPGISPTALLDSPIMIPNSQAMLSPTTASFAMLPPLIDEGLMMLPSITHKFKPQVNLGPNSLSHYHASLNQVSSKCWSMNEEHEDINMLVQDFSVPKDFANNYSARNSGVHFDNDASNDEDIRRQLRLEEEQKEMSHETEGKTSEDDGYNWKKYGQKLVKGTEYPRSYYKCAQPNCQVKKKVERSHDGQITEIIYRGNHNHAIPHSSRRGSTSSNDEMLDIQSWEKDAKHDTKWMLDGQERSSPPSFGTELSDPRKRFRLDNTEERYSTLANHNADKDRATKAVLRLGDDVEDAESKLKRRKESYPGETKVPPTIVREPRVVVQIESEVDVLDDGYRWRKYGQKIVSGNTNPRSYYKCTSATCMVKKQVERSSHNLKYVINTYEGKHNHKVPAAGNKNQIRSKDIAFPCRAVNMPKFETRQTLASHFDRKPDFGNEFIRSSLMGNFSNDMKFGPSSMSQMKYSSLNNIIPYSVYGTSLDSGVAPQARTMSSIFSEFPMPLPVNLPSSDRFSLSGIFFNYAKPLSSVQSYLSGQHMNDIGTKFF